MTKVVFRKARKDAEIVAFFPEIKTGDYILSYAHIGQHSDAHKDYYSRNTVKATEQEYQTLLNELIGQGYDDLEIVNSL